MDPSFISTVTGLGTLAGLNLYLTVLLTGLAVRFNFLNLGQRNNAHLKNQYQIKNFIIDFMSGALSLNFKLNFRATFIHVLFIFVGGFYSRASNNSPDVQKSQSEVISRFPEIGVSGSESNKRFLSAVEEARKLRPDLFKSDDWPLRISREVESVYSLRRALLSQDVLKVAKEAVDFLHPNHSVQKEINTIGEEIKNIAGQLQALKSKEKSVSEAIVTLRKNADVNDKYTGILSGSFEHKLKAGSQRKAADELFQNFTSNLQKLERERNKLTEQIHKIVNELTGDNSSMPQTSAGQISQGNFTPSLRNFEGVKEAWSIDLLEDSWGPVLIADDIVFVSYAEGFHALKAKTGTKVWTFKTPDPAVVFCASAEHVYLQTLKGTCFCLSILSGRKVWQRDLKASENLYLWMLRFGDTLCVDSVDSTIGINANSGDIKWKIPRTEQHWLCSSVADGAFFIQDDHTLRRFDGTTGSLLSAERLVVPKATLDCVRNGRLYFGQSAIGGLVTLSPVIYSINLGGKSPLWLKRYNFDTKGVHVIDVWRNCVLVLFEMEGAAMFTLDGVEVWRKKVSDKMIYGYVDQDVFYCGYNGGLIAFRCNDGAELAKIQIHDMWPEFISVNKNMIICKSMSTTSANPIPRYKLFSFFK